MAMFAGLDLWLQVDGGVRDRRNRRVVAKGCGHASKMISAGASVLAQGASAQLLAFGQQSPALRVSPRSRLVARENQRGARGVAEGQGKTLDC